METTEKILCSVIVPSYNRRDTLEMVLDGLAQQTLSQKAYEVVVVLDGSTDDSPQMLAEWQRSGRIANMRWHRQQNSGVATARNTGVGLSTGQFVLFLDDDIVPAPDLLERHTAHHAAGGDCTMVIDNPRSLYQNYIWMWWEDHYHKRALPGHVSTYRDFTSGNVSLRRDEFLQAGGFDTGFKGYNTEDYELGYRLLKAGVRFVPDRQLRAKHYHRTPIGGNIMRGSRNEGRGDVHFGTKHPELRRNMRLMHVSEDEWGRLTRLAMDAPSRGDAMLQSRLRLLNIYERLNLRGRWMKLFFQLRHYAYWRGVDDALGGWDALRAFQDSAPQIPDVVLDISDGLPPTPPPSWNDVQNRLTVTYRGQRVGRLQLSDGVERPMHDYMAQALMWQMGVRLLSVMAKPAMRTTKPPAALCQADLPTEHTCP